MKIKDLGLALSAAGKKELRHYLNGVLLTPQYIVASDGRKLVRIMHDNDNALPLPDEMIVPVEAVTSFLKKCSKKDHERPCEVVKIGDSYALQHGSVVEVFTPIDVKYPNFQKHFDNIRVERDPPNADTHYDYEYLGAAQKAINTYLLTAQPQRFNRRDTLGYFAPCESIIYIVMPCTL